MESSSIVDELIDGSICITDPKVWSEIVNWPRDKQLILKVTTYDENKPALLRSETRFALVVRSLNKPFNEVRAKMLGVDSHKLSNGNYAHYPRFSGNTMVLLNPNNMYIEIAKPAVGNQYVAFSESLYTF